MRIFILRTAYTYLYMEKDMQTGWVFVVLIIVALAAVCFMFTAEPSGPPSMSNRTSYGIVGRFRLMSEEELTKFNAKVIAWFKAQGLTVATDRSFAAIAEKPEWDMPGTTLRKSFDKGNQIIVFVPEQQPERLRSVCIPFSTSLRGELDVVEERTAFWQKLAVDFDEAFPSTQQNAVIPDMKP